MTHVTSKPVMRHEGEAKRRRCLKCEKKFYSRGIGERICGACKSGPDWRAGVKYGAGHTPAAHVGKRSATE